MVNSCGGRGGGGGVGGGEVREKKETVYFLISLYFPLQLPPPPSPLHTVHLGRFKTFVVNREKIGIEEFFEVKSSNM